MSRTSGTPRTSPPPSLPASSRFHAPRFCSSRHERFRSTCTFDRCLTVLWRCFISFLVNGDSFHSTSTFYQEGRDSCRLLFYGARFREGSQYRLIELLVSILQLSFINTVLEPVTVFTNQCIESFRPLPTTNIQKLTIHSYRWLRGQTSNPAHKLLQS